MKIRVKLKRTVVEYATVTVEADKISQAVAAVKRIVADEPDRWCDSSSRISVEDAEMVQAVGD